MHFVSTEEPVKYIFKVIIIIEFAMSVMVIKFKRVYIYIIVLTTNLKTHLAVGTKKSGSNFDDFFKSVNCFFKSSNN